MINVSDLIAEFQYPLEQGWGYIWGAVGQIWTQAKQDAATREMTVKYGQRWVGKHVIDCSGMFYRAYKNLGYSIYHGSNTIWKKYCSTQGQLMHGARADGQPIKPGTAVFLYRKSDNNRHHIGLYVGNNTVIEAKGTINGVVTSRLDHWDEWGELKDVDYSTVEGDIVMPILRKGSRGEAVKALQELLNAWYEEYQRPLDYMPLKVDGVFGNATKSAVEAFQYASGLEVDGIAGEQTQMMLAAYNAKPTGPLLPDAPAAQELPEDDDEVDEPIQMVQLTRAEVERIRAGLREIESILTRAIS